MQAQLNQNRTFHLVPTLTALLLVLSLLAHGGVHKEFKLAMFLLLVLSLMFVGTTYRGLNLLCILLGIVCLVQVMPIPVPLHKIISPNLAEIRDLLGFRNGFYPIAPDLESAIGGWVYIFSICAAIYLFADYFNGRTTALILTIVFILGVVEAYYGILAYVFKSESFILFGKRVSSDYASGSFVNKNHFGFLMAISAVIGLCLTGEQIRIWRSNVGKNNFVKIVLLGVSIILITTALVLSKSRGSLASFLVATAAMFVANRSKKLNHYIVLCSAVLLCCGSVLFYLGDFGTFEKLDNGSNRPELWGATVNLIRNDSKLAGIAPDSFEYVFEKYNNLSGNAALYQHPHNEYLAFIVDFGLVAGLLVISLMLILGIKFYKTIHKSGCDNGSVVVFAMFCAIASNFLFDFNFRIPTNGLIFTIVIGYMVSKTMNSKQISIHKFRYFFMPGLCILVCVLSVIDLSAEQFIPLRGHVLMQKGFEMYKKQDFSEAIKYLSLANKVAPFDPQISLNSAFVYEDLYRNTGEKRYLDNLESCVMNGKLSCSELSLLLKELRLINLKYSMLEQLFGFYPECSSTFTESIIAQRRTDLLLPLINSVKNSSKQIGIIDTASVLDKYGENDLVLYLLTDSTVGCAGDIRCSELLSSSYVGIGDYISAEKEYMRLMKLVSKPQYYVKLSDVYHKLGRKDRELELITQGNISYPDDPHICERYASLLADNLKYFESASVYLRYLRITRDKSKISKVIDIADRGNMTKSKILDDLYIIFAHDRESLDAIKLAY